MTMEEWVRTAARPNEAGDMAHMPTEVLFAKAREVDAELAALRERVRVLEAALRVALHSRITNPLTNSH